MGTAGFVRLVHGIGVDREAAVCVGLSGGFREALGHGGQCGSRPVWLSALGLG